MCKAYVTGIVMACTFLSAELARAAPACQDGRPVRLVGKIEEINSDEILAAWSDPDGSCSADTGIVAISFASAGGTPSRCSRGEFVGAQGIFSDNHRMYFNTVIVTEPKNFECK